MPPFLSKKELSDLLVTAWEGGSNYWVDSAKYISPKGMTYDELHHLAWENLPEEDKEFWKEEKGVPLYSMLPYIPSSVKWKIRFVPTDVINEEGEKFYLTAENMKEAGPQVAKTHPQIFKRIKEGQFDAGDADVWLQTALFNEVIFG